MQKRDSSPIVRVDKCHCGGVVHPCCSKNGITTIDPQNSSKEAVVAMQESFREKGWK